MSLNDFVKNVIEESFPKGEMLIRRTEGSPNIEFFGINQKGIAIPLGRIDEFIAELEKTCVDPKTTYKLGDGDAIVEIPGKRVPSVIDYLKEAKEKRVENPLYIRFF